MKKKLKLAFEQLEKELFPISSIEMNSFKGGTSTGISQFGLNDCVIHAIAFATGLDYNQVLDRYGIWRSNSTGNSSGAEEFNAVFGGITNDVAANFAQYMGLTNAGDDPQGPTGYSVMGDQSVAFLNNGDGTGHAIVLTGNASSTHYYYYDPQNGTTGTIRKLDPMIVGTYGY